MFETGLVLNTRRVDLGLKIVGVEHYFFIACLLSRDRAAKRHYCHYRELLSSYLKSLNLQLKLTCLKDSEDTKSEEKFLLILLNTTEHETSHLVIHKQSSAHEESSTVPDANKEVFR